MKPNLTKPAPVQMTRWLAEDSALLKAFDANNAERRRRHTQKIVDQMAEESTPANCVHAA